MPRRLNRANINARAARRLGGIEIQEARAKKAAARLETVRLTEEARRLETIAAEERLMIRAKGKAERDKIAPPMKYHEKRDARREQAREVLAAGTVGEGFHIPPKERDYSARVDSVGTIHREYLPPMRTPDEPKVAVPEQSRTEKWHPGCGRPFTVADAVAAHPRETYAPAGGGSRRGGVAAINPIFDNGEDSPSVSAPNGVRLGRNGFSWKDYL